MYWIYLFCLSGHTGNNFHITTIMKNTQINKFTQINNYKMPPSSSSSSFRPRSFCHSALCLLLCHVSMWWAVCVSLVACFIIGDIDRLFMSRPYSLYAVMMVRKAFQSNCWKLSRTIFFLLLIKCLYCCCTATVSILL